MRTGRMNKILHNSNEEPESAGCAPTTGSVRRIEYCPALPEMEHLWSIPNRRAGVAIRGCLWCGERRSLDEFPDYDGPINDLDTQNAEVQAAGKTPNP